MNAFTKHPSRQGLSYVGHWLFAMGIALRLLWSVAAFAVHAVLPFVSIEPRLDLEATSRFLLERNRFVSAAATLHGPALADRTSSRSDRRNTPAVA